MRKLAMSMFAILTVAAAMVGGFGAFGAPLEANAGFPGANGKIAFYRFCSGLNPYAQIWTMNPDGSDAVRVPFPFPAILPAWSPGGDQLTVTQVGNGWENDEVWVSSATGTNLHNLSNRYGNDSVSAWSGDGRVVYSGATFENGVWNNDVYIRASDGTPPSRLTTAPGSDGGPKGSPDGTTILFGRDDGSIWTMKSDGTGKAALSALGTGLGGADWSPDGTRLAYLKAIFDGSGNYVSADLWVANLDGTGARFVAAQALSSPAWSPDGARIAFTTPQWGGYEIATVKLDGSNLQRITTDGCSSSPSWQSIPAPADTIPPTITASATKADGTTYAPASWTNQTVAVHYTCTDSGSGVASCPVDQVYSAEGTFSATGNAADVAGNTATVSFGPIRIDKTPPTFGASTSQSLGVPAQQPWTDTGIDIPAGATVQIAASGRIRIAGSDPGKFPDGRTFDYETPGTSCLGSNWVVQTAACWSLIGRVGATSGFAVGNGLTFVSAVGGRLYLGVNDDVFGDNSGAWAATVAVSTAGVTYTKADGTAYATGTWTNQAVTVHFVCSDALSGVASCPLDHTFSGDGTYSGFETATDAAGNTATVRFGPVLIDNTGTAVTVHLVDHGGSGLVGGTASAYYSGSWHAIAGATDANGVLSVGAIPRNSGLSIAVTYNGTRLQLNYSQLTSSDFTFQTKLVTMKLQDHAGQPLDIGDGSYYAGSWRPVGNTVGGSISTEMLPGTYSFAMTHNGTRQQIDGQNIATGQTVTFQAIGVAVRLQDHSGAPLDVGSASYYAGSWRTIGSTAGGQAPIIEMLPGSYSFAMTYNGTRRQLDAQNVTTSPTITFQTVGVSVKLQDHAGTALDTGSASYYASSWRTIGNTSGGQVLVEMLPGTYGFAMTYLGSRQQLDSQNIGDNPNVVFKTGKVHSASGTATKYYAGSWLTFTQDMDLLPGTWTFSFSGHANTSQAITGGVINNIY